MKEHQILWLDKKVKKEILSLVGLILLTLAGIIIGFGWFWFAMLPAVSTFIRVLECICGVMILINVTYRTFIKIPIKYKFLKRVKDLRNKIKKGGS